MLAHCPGPASAGACRAGQESEAGPSDRVRGRRPPKLGPAMVFFTVFATIDSMTLLFAMTGLLGSSAYSLKAIADLEYAPPLVETNSYKAM